MVDAVQCVETVDFIRYIDECSAQIFAYSTEHAQVERFSRTARIMVETGRRAEMVTSTPSISSTDIIDRVTARYRW